MTLAGKYGAKPITLSEAKNSSTYLNNGWSSNIWKFEEGSFPTLLPSGSRTFTGFSKYLGTVIAPPNHLKLSTYRDNTWDMERVWYINEGYETPRLVYRARAYLGIPLTHNMNYFYVIPHVMGTMNYMGLTWKSKGAFFSFPNPPSIGVVGQKVTYSIPDSDLIQNINHRTDGDIRIEWFASGVRDVEGAGGFGSYNNQKRRTLTVSDISSATVNFYFTQPQWIPKVNYKLSVSTPDGIVDLAVDYKSKNAIRFCVSSEIELGIPVVELNNDLATQIHVSMPDGIKALQALIPYKNIEMLED